MLAPMMKLSGIYLSFNDSLMYYLYLFIYIFIVIDIKYILQFAYLGPV